MNEKTLWIICGATACGKSDLALQLAKMYQGEVVNADSRQIYRGLEIGTAAPKASMLKQARHHLYSFLPPDQIYSAADYQKQARQTIAEIFKREKQPIVVGGTGLYIKALIDGLSKLPPKNEVLRAQLEQRLQTEGAQKLHQELQKIDPISAQKIPLQNRQRLIRALEVYALTHQALSTLQKQNVPEKISYKVKLLGIRLDKTLLRQRIVKRSAEIFPGILQETDALLKSGFLPQAPALQSLGYRQSLQVLNGQLSQDQALESLITQTWQYAKRQQTWFNADSRISWLTENFLENASKIL